MTRVLPAEKGLLWALMHDPAAVLPWLGHLEPEDLQGLSTSHILSTALEVGPADPEATPNALMERLNTVEAELLAAMAAEASAPVSRPDVCVQSLKRRRLEREQAEVQREIDRLQAQGDTGPALNELLRRKLTVQRALERGDRVNGLQ